MDRTVRRQLSAAVAACLLALVGAACGGGDDDVASTSTTTGDSTTTETALEGDAVADEEPDTTTSEVDEDAPSGPTEFADVMDLEPLHPGATELYPHGEPNGMRLRLGPAEPASADEADALFGGYEGGEAERRPASLAMGDDSVDLGDVVLPTAFPEPFLEANAGRTSVTIENLALDDVSLVPAGTPAAETCVASDTNETVGGWRYDGSPGYLTVAFTVDTTEAGDVGGVGILLSWNAPFDRELFDGVDLSEYVDRCTDESGQTQWGWGTLTNSR